ncbi:lipopolysaccharide biosynthesis protein [Lacticaseibacillus sp. GG6-2]
MKQPLNRTKAASLNAATMMITQTIGLLLKFAVQTAFIHEFSQSYLGLNGLFANVLSFLSFADLGIGTAITMALYKPIADGNIPELQALMRVFRKAYRYISIAVIVAAVVLAPFIHFFIKDSVFSGVQIAVWFLLYAVSMVATYFSAHKRSYIMATQNGYLNTLNDFTFKSIQQISQFIIIFVFHSFTGFLVIQGLMAVVSNWQLSHMTDRRYPEVFKAEPADYALTAEVKGGIKRNVIGALASKIAEIVVLGSDNLLLSAFIGLVSVAKYSNYMLIVQAVNSLIQQVLGAFIASIGNLHVTTSVKWQETVIYRLQYLNAFMNLFVTVGLAFGMNIFINMWAGPKYLLSPLVMIVIVMNFSITQSRYTSLNFISGMGLYWETRNKAIIESVINLVLSLGFILIAHLGVLGVVLGTLCSNLIINVVWDPWIVFHNGLHLSIRPYMIRYAFYQVFITLCGIAAMKLGQHFSGISFAELILGLVVIEIVALALFVLATMHTREFKYSVGMVNKQLQRFKH